MANCRKLLYKLVVWLRNTCKRRKYPSVVKCRGKINSAAVNYRGKQMTKTFQFF